tara:strand:+ start:185 stop:529 length:345 start_codon:yes stop_codon:yes gene_type:complete
MENIAIHNEAVEAAKKAVKEIQDEYVKNNPDNPHKEPFYCGFAWVKIRPATTAFARALKKEGVVDYVSYNGGYDISNPSDYHGQSMNFQEAGARAYADVLNNHGIRATSMSRPD